MTSPTTAVRRERLRAVRPVSPELPATAMKPSIATSRVTLKKNPDKKRKIIKCTPEPFGVHCLDGNTSISAVQEKFCPWSNSCRNRTEEGKSKNPHSTHIQWPIWSTFENVDQSHWAVYLNWITWVPFCVCWQRKKIIPRIYNVRMRRRHEARGMLSNRLWRNPMSMQQWGQLQPTRGIFEYSNILPQ